jgi:hypothetical protein
MRHRRAARPGAAGAVNAARAHDSAGFAGAQGEKASEKGSRKNDPLHRHPLTLGAGRSSNSPITHSTAEAWTGSRHRRALSLTCANSFGKILVPPHKIEID